jgi:hypothetical protein
MARFTRRGFTIADLAGTIVGMTLLAASSGVLLGMGLGTDDEQDEQTTKTRATARKVKDATHIRGIHQSFVLFAQNNMDRYPLPSALDISGDTVAGTPESKDTTANIYSILVYQNFLTPELLVSPVETNKQIEVYGKYSYTEPAKAVNPRKALWDPSFSGDFTGTAKSHASYAHAMPWKGRLDGPWSNSFDSSQAVVCNRGPEIKDVAYNEQNTEATMLLANSKSRTLHFFDASEEPRKDDDPVLWRGNIVFNDNSLHFRTSKYGDGQTVTEKDVGMFRFSEERKRPDLAFYNEDPNPKEDNQFLGIFLTSGKARSDWKSIWD